MALPPFLSHHLYSFAYAFYLHAVLFVTTVLLLLFARGCNMKQHLDSETSLYDKRKGCCIKIEFLKIFSL